MGCEQVTQRMIATVQRDANPDSPHTALDEFHNAQVAAHTAEKTERTRKLRKIQTAATVAGSAFTGPVRNPDRVLEGLDRERAIRERLAANASPRSHQRRSKHHECRNQSRAHPRRPPRNPCRQARRKDDPAPGAASEALPARAVVAAPVVPPRKLAARHTFAQLRCFCFAGSVQSLCK